MTRVSLVTCERFPAMEDDDQPTIPALAARGIEAVPCVWNDPAVDWDGFDLNVVRNPWDYTDHVDDFVAWARRTPRLANPGPVIAWNVDKHYLAEIAAAGVPTIPTTYVEPGEPLPDLGAAGEVVVKPTVSAGSRDTLRLDDPDAVVAQIELIRSTGRTAMVQPYLAAVDEVGETATIWLGGRFSHAARKGPLLPLGRSLVEGLYAPELMAPREASAAELDVAAAALAAIPGGAGRDLLYARVDLIPDADGQPTVLEIEITEPTLFLEIGGAHARFADAIAAAAATAADR